MKLKRIFLLPVILSLLVGCVPKMQEPISKTGFYFDTVVTITLYDTQNKNILKQCMTLCADFEQKLSRTIPESEISKINAANGQPVEVSDLTVELIKKGLFYSELTNGAFDITIAPLSNLWDFKSEKPLLPSETIIQEALSHVNYKNIKIENNTVTLTDPKSAIDLGGIAKGYMADLLKDYLISQGVTKAIINLGGNVLTIGNKPDGSSFAIGIQKPFAGQNTPITAVAVKNQSVVTSGVYERYFQLEGRIYHHILNPATGYPVENTLYSVTILSDRSVDGDALSTSCFALGLEEGITLIQSLENIEAIFITNNYKIIDTRTLNQ